MSNARLPTVTSNIPRDLRLFIDRVRETLGEGVMTKKEVTRIIKETGAGGGGNGGGSVSTPTAPTGFTAQGISGGILTRWDTASYSGHSHTEVWASHVDDLAQAESVGMAPGTSFIHAVGPGVSRFYWARHVNTSGVAGPYNAQNGTYATSLASSSLEDIDRTLDESLLTKLLEEKLTDATMFVRQELDRLRNTTFVEHTQTAERFSEAWASVDKINAEVDAIIGAPVWSSTASYAAGDTVQYEGRLYQALVATGPSATPPSESPSWKHVGSLAMLQAEMGEQIAALLALTARVSETEAGYEAIATALLRAGLAYTTPDGVVAVTEAALGLFSRIADVEGVLTAQSELLSAVKSTLSDADGNLLGARALDQLRTEVQTARGEYSSLAARMSGVDAKVNDKVGSAAFSTLSARVENAEGKLTTQGQALTSIGSQLADMDTSLAVEAAALDKLETEVQTARGSSTSLANRISGVETRVDGKADSSAFNALSSRVTTAEGGIATNASNIAGLSTRLLNAEGKINAEALALDKVETEVKQARGSYSTLASRVNELQVGVNNALTPADEPAIFAAMQERGVVWADGAGEGTAGAVYTLKLRAKDNTGEAQVGFGLSAVKEGNQWVADVRFSASRFAIMDPYGAIKYPFKIVNGTVYIEDLVVGTVNMESNSVTVPVGGTGYGSIPYADIYMSQAGAIYVNIMANILRSGGGTATATAWASCGNQYGPSFGASFGSGLSGFVQATGMFWVPAGTHRVGGGVSVTGSNWYIGTTAGFAMGMKR